MEYRCPVPNCAHVGLTITKVHYRQAHNLDRRQAEIQYGSPKSIKSFKPNKEKKDEKSAVFEAVKKSSTRTK